MKTPFYSILLKVLRKLYQVIEKSDSLYLNCVKDADAASEIIYKSLMADEPTMVARFGSNELNMILNYISVKGNSKSIIKYIKGEQFDWWWNKGVVKNLHEVAGFFPPEINEIEQFCELMIQDIPQVDILGSWLSKESAFKDELKQAKKVHIRLLEPFWSQNPWTNALAGKKVLIIHPFVSVIEKQYQKKELIFNQQVLPDFELKTIKSVVSLANESTEFSNWFEALEWMKREIDQQDYDICLIGAGAYGFPLAAHVKRSGKKAIHLGGALQLLFGIRGKRWEDPNYGVKEWGIPYGSYSNLINEHWVRPGDELKPKNVQRVEGGTYW